MAESLVCPANHRWDPAVGTEYRSEQAAPWRCPVCGDLPAPGSRVRHSYTWVMAIVAIVLLIVPPVLVSVALMKAGVDPEGFKAVYFVGFLAWIGLLALLLIRHTNRRHRELERAATALGLSFERNRQKESMSGMTGFQLVKAYPNVRAPWWASGLFQGTAVVVAELYRRWGAKNGDTHLVVFFANRLPGLPDFVLTATPDQRRFWNWDLLQLVGLRRRPLLADEPFGKLYRLQGHTGSELPPWLTANVREALVGSPGWGVEARGGALLLSWSWAAVSPRSLPVLLSLAWRVREALRLAARELETREGARA